MHNKIARLVLIMPGLTLVARVEERVHFFLCRQGNVIVELGHDPSQVDQDGIFLPLDVVRRELVVAIEPDLAKDMHRVVGASNEPTARTQYIPVSGYHKIGTVQYLLSAGIRFVQSLSLDSRLDHVLDRFGHIHDKHVRVGQPDPIVGQLLIEDAQHFAHFGPVSGEPVLEGRTPLVHIHQMITVTLAVELPVRSDDRIVPLVADRHDHEEDSALVSAELFHA